MARKVLSPVSGRKIKVDGQVAKQLHSEGKLPKCKGGYIVSPESFHCIKRFGPTAQRLREEGVLLDRKPRKSASKKKSKSRKMIKVRKSDGSCASSRVPSPAGHCIEPYGGFANKMRQLAGLEPWYKPCKPNAVRRAEHPRRCMSPVEGLEVYQQSPEQQQFEAIRKARGRQSRLVNQGVPLLLEEPAMVVEKPQEQSQEKPQEQPQEQSQEQSQEKPQEQPQ